MTDHDPELAEDAQLRLRVWWRFWGSWRWTKLVLVVLVVVAWSTKPGKELHVRGLGHHDAGFVRLQSTSRDQAGQVKSVRRRQAEAMQLAKARDVLRIISNSVAFEDLILVSLTRDFQGAGAVRSIGFLGMVWILD